MTPTILIAITIVGFGLTACNRSQNQPTTVAGADPANGNLAPADQTPAPDSQSPAPPAPTADAGQYAVPSDANPSDEAAVDPSAQTIEAPDPPPPLPEYDQPPCPGDDYLWTPGYWDYADTGYYWVPGAWVMSPYVGALWTPPWWGYGNNVYILHAGYWGPHIGFYGGINYGFGYTGRGYYGAYWNTGKVVYNRTVTNVNVSVVHNVYNYTVPSSRGARVSYNGGRGGIAVRPTTQETAALRDRRTAPVAAQIQHAREASSNREQFAAGGHAQPGTLVAAHPLSTDYRAPAERAPERIPSQRPAERAPERIPSQRPGEPATSRDVRSEPQAVQPAPRQFGRPQATQPAPPSASGRNRQQPEAHPQPTPRSPAPSSAERIHQQPEQRPAPAAHPTTPEARPPQQESHADRQARPEAPAHQAPPQEHPTPQVHQAPQEQHQASPPPPKKKGQ